MRTRIAHRRTGRALPRLLLVLLVLPAAGVAACGEDKEAKRATVEKVQREKQQAKDRAEAKREAEAHRRQAQAKAAKCASEFDPLLTELSELGSRLDIGLSYDDYTNQVGDLKVAYDKVDFASAEADALECLSAVGLPSEAALNQYTRASNAWSKCFDDVNCSNDSVKPTLQRHWSQASRKTAAAKRGLQKLKDAA